MSCYSDFKKYEKCDGIWFVNKDVSESNSTWQEKKKEKPTKKAQAWLASNECVTLSVTHEHDQKITIQLLLGRAGQ